MKNPRFLLATLIVPAALLGATASASANKGPKHLFQKLVKVQALEQSDLDGIKQIHKDLRACHTQVKEGAQPKGTCKAKFMEAMKARIALLEKAAPKVTDAKLQKRVNRTLRHLSKKLARIEKKMTGTPAAPPAN
jgi:hypothetical protein